MAPKAPKLKSLFRCQGCGFAGPKWLGQCPECEAWNTLAEEVVEAGPAKKAGAGGLTGFSSEPASLKALAAEEPARRPTGLDELDRLLGGGLVEGQVVLLAGPPGIGKSTLILQAAASLAAQGPSGVGRAESGPVLYASGEESLSQLAGRARRLGIAGDGLLLVSESDLGRVLEAVRKHKPSVLVLDSVQTACHPDLAGSAGSVGQVRECAAEVLREAKGRGMAAWLLGHVTKEGSLAGPRVLEHLVDTVLYFDAERHHGYRVLRVHKNRFGPASELGVFEMGDRGLSGVADASAFFLADAAAGDLPGRAVSVAMEGTRPLVAEVQALVAATRYPLPRRMATGLDLNRLLVLVAALEKHLKLRLETRDVFVSLSGGLKPKDPALDLAACMAMVSSVREAALAADCVFLGEVGLLGQVGRVPFMSARLREAARLGFKRAVVPARSLREADVRAGAAIAVEGVESVAACAARLGGAPRRREPEEAVTEENA